MQNGVSISEDYLSQESLGTFVKGLIGEIEGNRNWVNTFNMVSAYELAEQIKEVIYDYHFMTMRTSDWFHKPGRTAILKYKYQPSKNLNWSNESAVMSYSQLIYSAPTCYYTSDIYYVVY